MQKQVALICDANVLIDFLNTEEELFISINKLYQLYIPDILLKEVDGLDEAKAEVLLITIVETSFDIISESMNTLPGCSFEDTIFFNMAKKNKWILACNDRKLRRECINGGVDILWGLQVLIKLVENEIISTKEASKYALIISESNREITTTILEEFNNKLSRL